MGLIIKVDSTYRLDVVSEMLNDKIGYVNHIPGPKYIWWREIDGRPVKIKSKTRLIVDYYVASLMNDSNNPFYVTGKCLGLWTASDLQCKCESFNLFWFGCRCGAFKNEKALS